VPRLYRQFGFETEGTQRAHAFRPGWNRRSWCSNSVIRVNGALFIEVFSEPAVYGAQPGLRFHLDL
jgi:hypothetical protein